MTHRIANHRPQSGFTLVETIAYVAIFSIFISFALGFFWQMQQARIKSGIVREVKENAAQAFELLKTEVRNAQSVDAPGSQLGQTLGTLSLTRTDGTALFDTALKSITVGGVPLEIRKLRLRLPGQLAEDATSDHVTVARFEISDVGGAGLPTALRIQMTLASVNPGQDPLYDFTMDFDSTLSFRTETL
ncbi:prepilin-type N-terminal cleavage/methylation domain-containing protein [Candidatus Peregrinibacteria bacterium]|nr:prepilin-type N-terminal cleavage/methylation domain-containing protein [Candidatus Peregrinibacteria bacterium]